MVSAQPTIQKANFDGCARKSAVKRSIEKPS